MWKLIQNKYKSLQYDYAGSLRLTFKSCKYLKFQSNLKYEQSYLIARLRNFAHPSLVKAVIWLSNQHRNYGKVLPKNSYEFVQWHQLQKQKFSLKYFSCALLNKKISSSVSEFIPGCFSVLRNCYRPFSTLDITRRISQEWKTAEVQWSGREIILNFIKSQKKAQCRMMIL